MKRRYFLRFLAAGLVAPTIDIEKLLWIPKQKLIFIPSPAQIAFLYGIPYHQSNASTSSWLGFHRIDYVNDIDWKVFRESAVLSKHKE